MSQVVALEIGVLDDAVLVEVAQRGHHPDTLAAGAHAEGVVVGEPVAGHQLVLPVDDGVGVRVEVVVPAVVGDVFVRVERDGAVVLRGPARKVHVLLGVDHVRIDHGALPAHVAAVGDGEFAFVRTLGGDEDDSVGRTASVDGRRGGVLEHRDLVDLRGVHGVEVALHAVDKHERGAVRASERTDAADLDVSGIGAGSTARRGDRHSRSDALEGGRKLRDRSAGKLFGGDGRDRTGQVDLLLRVVSHHDYVFEEILVRFEGDAECGLLADFYEFLLESEEGDHKGLPFGDGERELTLVVGNGAFGRAADDDSGSGEGFAICIRNCAGDAPRLGRGGQQVQDKHN